MRKDGFISMVLQFKGVVRPFPNNLVSIILQEDNSQVENVQLLNIPGVLITNSSFPESYHIYREIRGKRDKFQSIGISYHVKFHGSLQFAKDCTNMACLGWLPPFSQKEARLRSAVLHVNKPQNFWHNASWTD